jgi:hypothetical protein
LPIDEMQQPLSAMGGPEGGSDVQGPGQSRRRFVATGRLEQVGGLERIEHGRERIELARRAHLRKAFVGSVLIQ